MSGVEDLASFVASVDWWQRWEISPGVFTPGGHDVARTMALMNVPASLAGLRVLDIGGWNGCFSFECERRGASEVVMIEPSSLESTHFERIRSFLGSSVQRVPGTIYDLNPDKYGEFDVVLFCGVIYHLRYPLLGIDNIRRLCRNHLFTESAVLDEASMDGHGGIRSADSISIQMNKTPLLQFAAQNEYFNDFTNWFIPNEIALNAMLFAGGFEVQHSIVEGRYYSRSRRIDGAAPMLSHAHEGIDYETHARHLLGDVSRWAK